MATETEQLVVLLEARIRDFEKNMQKASGTAGREFGAIERRGQQSAKKVEGLFSGIGANINSSLKGFGGGILAGGIAGLVSEQAVRQLGEVVKSITDMADEAERVKLPVEDFQALGFVARQAGLEASNVTDLFQKFQLSIGEAAIKGNDLSTILEANGIKIRDANGKIREQKSLFYDVVNLIKNAATQQEAALIAMAAFGKSSKDALAFLQQGSDAIKEGEQAARDAGAVISKQLVEKAREFDDAWTATWDAWSAKGKSAILEVMTEVQDFGGALDALVRKSGLTSEALRGGGLMPGLNNNQIKDLEWMFPSLKDTSKAATAVETDLFALTKKRAELESHIAELKANDAAPIEIDEFQARLDLAIEKINLLQNKLNILRKAQLSDGPAWEKTGRGSIAAPSTVIPDLGGAASDLKGAAQSLEQATKGGILDLIGHAEGTDKGRGYNETLAYGAFTGGDQNLVIMSLREILALQTQMLKNPANTFNSSALGRYQITQSTLKDMIDKLGLSLDDTFGPAMQDKIAAALVAQRGNNPAGLRNEWEGLRNVPDANISTAMGNSANTFENGTKALNARTEATARLTEAQKAENESLQVEARTMGMSTFEAARLRKEHELLARAKQAGIPIDAALKASISSLATEYGKSQAAIERIQQAQERSAKTAQEMVAAQEKAAQASQALGQTFAGATKGFLNDLVAGKDATEALQTALMNLAQQFTGQAIDGIFASMFSAGGVGKGVSGGGLGALLGFRDGGMIRGIGTGTSDSIPIAVSNGEYIVNAQATARHGRLLEAINNGDVQRFASGGLVGVLPMPQSPSVAANVMGGQVVHLNTNVTVNAAGGAGDHAQNAELALQISKQVESSVRGLVVREMRAQQRPGNILNRVGG